jgi:hypothetical protein
MAPDELSSIANLQPYGMSTESGQMACARLTGGLAAAVAALFLVIAHPQRVEAQDSRPHPVGSEVFTEGELERYLRVLQNAGRAEAYPWSLRGFGTAEVATMAPDAAAGHPWAARFSFAATDSAESWGWLRPRGSILYNSAFPDGGEGPVWAGQGLTTTLEGGVHARYGPVSLVLAPVLFRAENGDYTMAPTGQDGVGAYRNAISPEQIDVPQRFGSTAYTRLDPGNSTIRLDQFGVAVAISTASQQWGPGERNPLVVGTNAGGFPHAFAGTTRPLNVFVGRLHGRLVVGRLDQSPYSPVEQGEEARLMNGAVVVYMPRGLSGLEVGVSRFYHTIWPETFELVDLLRPLESLLKERILDADDRDADNQLASIFFRWNFPAGGAEIFGEYMREDHSYDLRTFILEPDDLRSYLLGFRKTWTGADERFFVLRAEIMNAESSHRMRSGSRPGSEYTRFPMYEHGVLRQGHTQRGQLIATPYGHGGAASFVAVDRYDTRGRVTVEWERVLRGDRTDLGAAAGADATDVVHSIGFSMVRFSGPFDLSASLRGMYNLNRDFVSDVFNLSVQLGGAITF